MLHLHQTIVVEGKYDKAKLASLVDANIITTDGFDIFRNKEKLSLLRALAARTGLIVLTDSDGAGFRIRRHIAGTIPPEQVTHVYIPDLAGKERRKVRPGAEGLLGVEGVPDEALLEAFRKAGLTDEAVERCNESVTLTDLMEWGLTGGENSHRLRCRLLKALGLPGRMSTKALLRTVNTLYDRESFLRILEPLIQDAENIP